MPETLLKTTKIKKLESKFDALFETTLLKGIIGEKPENYKKQVKYWFSSKTFEKQIDKIIDDIYLTSISFTDKQVKKAVKSSLFIGSTLNLYSEADDTPLVLTEEAVRQADDLASEVVDSIVTMLKDEGIYKESPQTLEKRIRELWGGEKYRSTRFVRTFTADVATATTLHRYKQQEIQECQFYAKIDDRTSPQCRMLHGTVFKVGSPEADKYHCPAHHHCRSAILPITIFTEVNPDWRYENRDFTKQMDQNFKFTETEVDKKIIDKTFKNIDKFNEKYRIDKFILDEDLQKRFVRLGVGVNVEAPTTKVKTPKVKKETKVVKEKPKKEVTKTHNEVENTIRKHENKIKNRKTEKVYVFDKDGNIVFEKSGNKNSVKFTPDEAELLKGNTLTHNHPKSSSFSKADLQTACVRELKEVRAATKDGTFIIRMKDGSEFNKTFWDETLSTEFDKQLKAARIKHDIRMINKEMTKDESVVLTSKVVWAKVSQNIPELEYKFVKW